MTNLINYAHGLLQELEWATKKADKDAIKAELTWVSEEIQKVDVSSFDEDAKAHFADVVKRLAEVMDAK